MKILLIYHQKINQGKVALKIGSAKLRRILEGIKEREVEKIKRNKNYK
jgi:hypothetical protein